MLREGVFFAMLFKHIVPFFEGTGLKSDSKRVTEAMVMRLISYLDGFVLHGCDTGKGELESFMDNCNVLILFGVELCGKGPQI